MTIAILDEVAIGMGHRHSGIKITSWFIRHESINVTDVTGEMKWSGMERRLCIANKDNLDVIVKGIH